MAEYQLQLLPMPWQRSSRQLRCDQI